MGFFNRIFSPPKEPVMKSIAYRGGVTFRIPAHWREEYSNLEGGMFYADHSDSGTLRLTIMTLAKPKLAQSPSALDMLEVIVNRLRNDGVVGVTKERKDGNAFFKYEQIISEEGVRLTIFNWIVANSLPPNRARVATFSYTILASQRNRLRIQRDLEILDAEIEAASFSERLGVVAE